MAEGIISTNDRESLSITTLQRYLNNPIVRNIFGLGDKEGLSSKHTEKTFKKLITRFLEDALKGTVHSRSKQEEWKEYANTLQREITDPPPKDSPVKDYNPKPKTESSEKTVVENKIKKPIKKSTPDPSTRKYVIPYDTKFTIKDKTLNRIYIELGKKTPIDEHEFSAAYLLRAFIEGSALLYLKKHLPETLQKDSKLNVRLKDISEHLLKTGIKKSKLQSLNIASSDKNALISPLLLGAMVHGSVIPTKRELTGIWDRMEDILHIIHDKLD